MIEIIREEADGTTEKLGLPKDIRQIGEPDIGDRIYVEDGAYRYLHPYGSMDEKRAYVLLGRFENYAGRQCVFIEAAIWLEEMAFEGEMPQWNDYTWAYIYKQLRREYGSMVIVGWALDICGRLPNMTERLEQLHRNNFGGAHQVLFLMDGLEREEAFYGSRGEHLSRRGGFYIYYEKSRKSVPMKWTTELEQNEEAEPTPETRVEEIAEEHGEEAGASDVGSEKRHGEAGWQELITEHFFSGKGAEHRGSYRKQLEEKEERQTGGAYASTLLLVTVACVLGITAYLNHEKLAAMEATLAQMNQEQVQLAAETDAEDTEVMVETVPGNVQKQDAAQSDSIEGETIAAEEVAGVNRTPEIAENGTQTAEDATDAQTAAGTVDAAGAQTAAGVADAAGAQTVVGTADAAGTQTAGTVDTAGAAASGDTAAASGTQTYLEQGYYVVQKGDSLVGICRKIYQTTAMMDTLCEANEIENPDSIYAGQYLKLPN